MFDFLLAALVVRIDRVLGPQPPTRPGRNLVGGNRDQDRYPLNNANRKALGL